MRPERRPGPEWTAAPKPPPFNLAYPHEIARRQNDFLRKVSMKVYHGPESCDGDSDDKSVTTVGLETR